MSKRTAFVFPGQGSQSVGMLSTLAEQFPSVQKIFAVASAALGYDLWELTQQGPVEKLNQTTYTQPALLAASVAIWQVWQEQSGQQPVVMAGHSLGEYTALVCANAINFSDAVKLVAERGRFMQEAVPEGTGAMAAIVGLADEKAREICEIAAEGHVLAPVNYNAIGQVVVAGESAAVNRAVSLAQQAGSKLAKRLPVSVPSHCALMKPAAERLSEYLNSIQYLAPAIPVINNVDVKTEVAPAAIKDALIRQLYNPVRWVEIIQTMAKQDIELIVECGPGKVLTGLTKRIEAKLPSVAINDPDSLKQALALLS